MQKNKKILITGSGGLSAELKKVYSTEHVVCTSRSNGESIEDVSTWGYKYLDYDIVFNCAFNDVGQIKVLKFFSNHWKNNKNKTIVNIGSIVSDYPRSEIDKERDFFEYRYSKQSLQQAFSDIAKSYSCDLRLINPGPIDTDMIKHIDCIKMNKYECAKNIKKIVDETKFRRVDFWE